eukprot:1161556-Pelagomonas_calceolata.AAC.1
MARWGVVGRAAQGVGWLRAWCGWRSGRGPFLPQSHPFTSAGAARAAAPSAAAPAAGCRPPALPTPLFKLGEEARAPELSVQAALTTAATGTTARRPALPQLPLASEISRTSLVRLHPTAPTAAATAAATASRSEDRLRALCGAPPAEVQLSTQATNPWGGASWQWAAQAPLP